MTSNDSARSQPHCVRISIAEEDNGLHLVSRKLQYWVVAAVAVLVVTGSY
jgi:uncharacterized membrane protein